MIDPDLDQESPAYRRKIEKSELASRYNTGKSPLSMILEARHAMEGMASVLDFGAKKYARGNWHKGLPHADICDSMLRHISAYLSGEDLDPESGKPHVDHIFTNAMFLAEGYRTHPELDNRSEELKRAKEHTGNTGYTNSTRQLGAEPTSFVSDWSTDC